MINWRGASAAGSTSQMIIGKRTPTAANYGLRITEDTAPVNKLTLYIRSGASSIICHGPVVQSGIDCFVAVSFEIGPNPSSAANSVCTFWYGPLGGTLTKYVAQAADYESFAITDGALPTDTIPIRIGASAVNGNDGVGGSVSYYFNGAIGPCGIIHANKDYGDTGAIAPTWDNLTTWAKDPDTIIQLHWMEMSVDGSRSTERDINTIMGWSPSRDWVATHKTGNDYDVNVVTTTSASIIRGGFYLEGTVPSDASTIPPQNIYPTQDISANGWQPFVNGVLSGQPLYDMVNEASADDSDYIQSPADPVGTEVCELKLGPVEDPLIHTGHAIQFRYKKGGVASNRINLTVQLYQGTSTKVTEAVLNDIGTGWVTGALNLTTTEAANITDYTDLRVRFIAAVDVDDESSSSSSGSSPSSNSSSSSSSGATTATAYFTTITSTLNGNLKGYWKFDEASVATAADIKSHDNLQSAAAYSNVAFGVAGAAGGTGTAVQSSSGGYVRLETTTNTNYRIANFTVNFWVKRTGAGTAVTSGTGGFGASTIEPIVAKGIAEAETLTQDINFLIGFLPASNKFGVDFESAAGSSYTSGGNPLTGTTTITRTGDITDWHMVTATYNGSALKIYLNGQPDGSLNQSAAPGTSTTSPLSVFRGMNSTGAIVTNSGQFIGCVDELTIWDTALSDAQITAIYDARDNIIADTDSSSSSSSSLVDLSQSSASSPSSLSSSSSSSSSSSGGGGAATNAEVDAWESRITSASGSLSAAHKGYATTFMNSLSTTLRGKIIRFNPFIGGLNGALQPLIRSINSADTSVVVGNAADTNVNFLAGDYTDTVGLTGNGTSKSLATGVAANATGLGISGTFGAYTKTVVSGAASSTLMGASNTPFTRLAYSGTQQQIVINWGTASAGTTNLVPTSGFIVGVRRSTTNQEIYVDGTSVANRTTADALTSVTAAIQIFARNAAGTITQWWVGDIGCYVIATALTVDEIAELSSAINTLMTSLGRKS